MDVNLKIKYLETLVDIEVLIKQEEVVFEHSLVESVHGLMRFLLRQSNSKEGS